MKKVLLVLSLLVLTAVLFACGPRVYEIAMITDTGDIDDRSFNQGTWEGIKEYAIENNKTYKYYKPTAVTLDAYVGAIELAVQGGAKIIVTPGFLFENSVHKAQSLFPDVKFILIDGAPHNVADWGTMATYDDEDVNFNIASNTLSIFFQEEQSGFFAGYAAIKDGKTKLGFMGGMAVPAVVRFGIGYVAGAYYAAKENNLTNFSFNHEYYEYLNTFAPSDAIVTKATSWYNTGTLDAIFAAAGGAGNSVMVAAQNTSKWMLGVDVDQSNLNTRVLTSAMKGLAVAVQSALDDFYNDEFVGGRSITLGAAEEAVGLPTTTASWRFSSFTVAAYTTVFNKVADGTVVVPVDAAGLQAFITAQGYTPSAALITRVAG
jgi:basic membrane protein A and related proteins